MALAVSDPCPPLPANNVDLCLLRWQAYPDCDTSTTYAWYQYWMEFSIDVAAGDEAASYIKDGNYRGYCVQEDYQITQTCYSTELISTYDTTNPNLPGYEWDKINYILNNKDANDNFWDINLAIWVYTLDRTAVVDPTCSDTETENITQNAMDLYTDAEANGGGFVPGEGEICAIYCYTGENVQDVLIEVVVPPDNDIPELPFGTITAILVMCGVVLAKSKNKLPTA
jgi:hypothetical protein